MNLDIASDVKITKYNPRTEINGDESVLAGDINVEMNVPIDDLRQIPVDKVDFKKLFYKDSGDLRGICFDTVSFNREYQEVDVFLQSEYLDQPLNLLGSTIKKVSATFIPGFRAMLRFQVQLHPDTELSGELHQATTLTDLRITVQPAGGQLDMEEAAEA